MRCFAFETQVLKEQIVEFARGETVDGRKVVDKIVAFALHQVRLPDSWVVVVQAWSYISQKAAQSLFQSSIARKN